MKLLRPLGIVAGATLLAACSSPAPTRTVTVLTPPATPAAAPSATAATTSASPTDGPSAASPTAASAAKVFCTPARGLCFPLAAGHTASMASSSSTAGNMTGRVQDASGAVVLTIAEDVSGIGGMCMDGSKKENTVVAVAPTRLTHLETTHTGSDRGYVVQVVVSDSQAGGYTAESFITNNPMYESVGPVLDCGLNFSDLFASSAKDSLFHLGVRGWTSRQDYERPQHFATVDEAKRQFDTPRYKAAWEMMKGAYFG